MPTVLFGMMLSACQSYPSQQAVKRRGPSTRLDRLVLDAGLQSLMLHDPAWGRWPRSRLNEERTLPLESPLVGGGRSSILHSVEAP